MMLSKATLNMAERRNINLWSYNVEDFYDGETWDGTGTKTHDRLSISPLDCNHDGAIVYRVTSEGFTFDSSHGYDSEEWPYMIKDEKHLRSLLDAMAEELSK